jgi:hypothetical protein
MGIKNTNIFQSMALKIFPQIGILGMKIYHLATLIQSENILGEK